MCICVRGYHEAGGTGVLFFFAVHGFGQSIFHFLFVCLFSFCQRGISLEVFLRGIHRLCFLEELTSREAASNSILFFLGNELFRYLSSSSFCRKKTALFLFFCKKRQGIFASHDLILFLFFHIRVPQVLCVFRVPQMRLRELATHRPRYCLQRHLVVRGFELSELQENF
jgi:hypothetical protein